MADWVTENGVGFDAHANYSRIWYQQVNATGDISDGKLGSRYVMIYPNYDCREASDYLARSIYLYSCQSDAGGQCDTVTYNVASFSIVNINQYLRSGYAHHDKCERFLRETGAAAVASGSLWAAAVAVFITVLLT